MTELILQVIASSDDCYRKLTSSYFGLTSQFQVVGASDVSNFKLGGGMRFQNVLIPHGAVINSAYLTLRCEYASSVDTVKSRISAEDVDDADTFANSADAFDTRWAARTTARVDWDSIVGWGLDSDYNSPEIKTVIQEVIDRVGWVSGNDIVIFWDDFDDRSTHSSSCYRRAYSYDGSTTYAPKLVVTYTAGWTHIAKVLGVTASAISKMNGVTVAAIAKVNGVSV